MLYDVHKQTVVQSDASPTGLGACLLQEGRPVAYAFRTLTQTKRMYAQIEKDMLGIVFACNKFHPFIYGKAVVVQTDHKPLEIIVRKPLCKAPPRLQRMLLQVQRYDLDVQNIPGRGMLLADALSREHLDDTDGSLQDDVEVRVHSFTDALSVSPSKLQQMAEATAEDQDLQQLRNTISSGWPDSIADVPQVVQPYWTLREELHEAKGILFKGHRIIIPRSMRNEMVAIIHETHMGTKKSKERARAVMYWPQMTRQIKYISSKCPICARFRNSNKKEPMMPHPLPQEPW